MIEDANEGAGEVATKTPVSRRSPPAPPAASAVPSAADADTNGSAGASAPTGEAAVAASGRSTTLWLVFVHDMGSARTLPKKHQYRLLARALQSTAQFRVADGAVRVFGGVSGRSLLTHLTASTSSSSTSSTITGRGVRHRHGDPGATARSRIGVAATGHVHAGRDGGRGGERVRVLPQPGGHGVRAVRVCSLRQQAQPGPDARLRRVQRRLPRGVPRRQAAPRGSVAVAHAARFRLTPTPPLAQ